MASIIRKKVKNQSRLVLLCSVVYFVSYITRINYAAVLVEFVKSTVFTEEQASFALTGLAVFYGAGQLVSGYLGDRIKPKILISCGLAVSAAMNAALPFCISVPALTAVWCVNGLAQSMMWPPIVKILTVSLSPDDYKKATVKVSIASQLATICIYLFAPLCIRFSGWKLIFFIASVCAVIMSVICFIAMPDICAEKRENSPADVRKTSNAGFPFVIFGLIMLVTVLQGIMRDGVSNWLPTYIETEFAVSSELAILVGAAPPILAMICYELTSLLSRKLLKNEMICAAAVFSVSFAAALVLAFFPSGSIALSVALSTIITSAMHCVNLILVSLIPPYFMKTGHVSFISGLINSCTYVGSAVSGWGFATISARVGWSGTISVWVIICFIAVAICFAISRKWAEYSADRR